MSFRPPVATDRPAGDPASGEHESIGPDAPDPTPGSDAARRTGGPAAPGKAPPSTIARWLRRVVVAGVAAGLVGVVLLVGANVYVTRSAEGLAFDAAADVPERPTAIVFGAGVVGGRATPALEDRVEGAVELYREGRVSHLLMTGDNSRPDYDEVTVMRDLAIAQGVPPEAITRDHAGFDTRSSCYRAHDIFGVQAAVLVTQDYHLPRALYTCRDLGIDAVGMRIPDWQHNADQLDWGQYPGSDSTKYMAREWLARANSLVEAHVTRPEPQYLGPYLGLGSDDGP